jgi:hypothetical protein
MALAYHKDVPTEVYVPIAIALLAGATFLLYRRLREPPQGDKTGPSNWGANAAIILGLAAASAYGLSWVVPTEAESGVRRTIGDVGIVIALGYILAVGPLLGIAGATLVGTRGQKLRATVGFVFGFVGFAWVVGAMVACMVSDGCFH